jgi:hypothetical protein
MCPKIATRRFKLRHRNKMPAAVSLENQTNRVCKNRFSILFSALDGGPGWRVFSFANGTSDATLQKVAVATGN